MKRIIYILFISLALAAVFGMPADVSAESEPSLTENKSHLDTLFMEGVNSYYAKNYAEAINIFKQVQGISPTYRSSQVRRYIRLSEGKLGKLGVKDVFKPGEHPTQEIEVIREGELEQLAKAAQQVLLDTYIYLQERETRYDIPRFDMQEPQSSVKMAKKAYDESQFTESIRLSNKARLQIDEIIQKKMDLEKPVLGEVGETPITLNLSNADLEQTLKLIYDLTGANIIMSKGISGKVTINVKDISLQRVLDLICEANHLKYIEENSVIKIMTKAEYDTRAKAIKEQNRRVFNIFYGDAALIAKALRETFKMESFVHDPRTNAIIVDVPNPALLQQIQDVISSLDTPISQVMMEAKIVEFVVSDESLFSIDWLISSRMIEGIDSTLTGPRFGDAMTHIPGVSATLPRGFSFGITNSDVNSLISALATKGEVQLIQSPKVMCLNGTTAIIRVVQNFPYIVPEYQETYNPTTGALTGRTQTVTIYDEEVGTEFEVTPIIQRNRTVFLTLNIFDSRLVEIKTLTAIAAGLTYETQQPIISSRETTQNVTLFDGQTLVIGGMVQHREEKSETGVPFLRKIPVLGFLFKKPEYRKTSSELLLFITPYIVTTYEEAEDMSRKDVEKSRKQIKPGILKHF